jgi:hypothetical protein
MTIGGPPDRPIADRANVAPQPREGAGGPRWYLCCGNDRLGADRLTDRYPPMGRQSFSTFAFLS